MTATRHPHRAPPCQRGLTLVEVVVALVLLLVVTTFALPTWRHWLARQELANRAQTLATALERARTEAIKRGHRVNLCKSPDAATCADEGDWSMGWILHVDALAEGRPGLDEPPIAHDPPVAAPIRVEGNGPVDDYVSFTPLGRAPAAVRGAPDGHVHALPRRPGRGPGGPRRDRQGPHGPDPVALPLSGSFRPASTAAQPRVHRPFPGAHLWSASFAGSPCGHLGCEASKRIRP